MFTVVLVIWFLAYKYFVPPKRKPLPGLCNVPEDNVNSYHLNTLPGGSFAELAFGKTRYYLFGSGAKRIVMLHGIGTSAIVFKDMANSLTKQGYQVLLFDFWGRGYSDGPAVNYDDALFVAQLRMLLAHVGWQRCEVVGWSLGGAVAAQFARQFPDIVERLILIAPAGLVKRIPYSAELVKNSLVGEIIMHSVGSWVMRRELARLNNHNANYFERYPAAAVLPQLLLDHLKYSKGFLRAYHSSLVHFPLGSMETAYQELGKRFDGQIEIVWGDADKIVPFSLLDELLSYLFAASYTVINGGAHDLPVTHSEEICNLIAAGGRGKNNHINDTQFRQTIFECSVENKQ